MSKKSMDTKAFEEKYADEINVAEKEIAAAQKAEKASLEQAGKEYDKAFDYGDPFYDNTVHLFSAHRPYKEDAKDGIMQLIDQEAEDYKTLLDNQNASEASAAQKEKDALTFMNKMEDYGKRYQSLDISSSMVEPITVFYEDEIRKHYSPVMQAFHKMLTDKDLGQNKKIIGGLQRLNKTHFKSTDLSLELFQNPLSNKTQIIEDTRNFGEVEHDMSTFFKMALHADSLSSETLYALAEYAGQLNTPQYRRAHNDPMVDYVADIMQRLYTHPCATRQVKNKVIENSRTDILPSLYELEKGDTKKIFDEMEKRIKSGELMAVWKTSQMLTGEKNPSEEEYNRFMGLLDASFKVSQEYAGNIALYLFAKPSRPKNLSERIMKRINAFAPEHREMIMHVAETYYHQTVMPKMTAAEKQAFNKKFAAEIAAAQAEMKAQPQKDNKLAEDYGQTFTYINQTTEMHGAMDWEKVELYIAQVDAATQEYRHVRQEQDKHGDSDKFKADAAAQYVDTLAKTAAQYEKQTGTMEYSYDTGVLFDDKVKQTLVQTVDDLGHSAKVVDKVSALNDKYLHDHDIAEAIVWANKRQFDIAKSRYKVGKRVKTGKTAQAQAAEPMTNGYGRSGKKGDGRGGRN